MIQQLFGEQEDEDRPQVQFKQLQVLPLISVQGSDARRRDVERTRTGRVGRGDRDSARVTGKRDKGGERRKDRRMQDRDNEPEDQAKANRPKVLSLYINKLHRLYIKDLR